MEQKKNPRSERLIIEQSIQKNGRSLSSRAFRRMAVHYRAEHSEEWPFIIELSIQKNGRSLLSGAFRRMAAHYRAEHSEEWPFIIEQSIQKNGRSLSSRAFRRMAVHYRAEHSEEWPFIIEQSIQKNGRSLSSRAFRRMAVHYRAEHSEEWPFIIEQSIQKNGRSLSSRAFRRMAVHYRAEHSEEWPFIKPGRKGKEFAWCEYCECDVSVRCGGRTDIVRHVETEKHSEATKRKKLQSSCRTISLMFMKKPVPDSGEAGERAVTRAELIFLDMVVEANLPLATMDKITKAVQQAFPDSAVASKFQCGRLKGTAMIKENATMHTSNLAERMRSGPFTVSTDGSKDHGNTKLFPLVVRTVDSDLTVRSDVFSVPAIEGSATG